MVSMLAVTHALFLSYYLFAWHSYKLPEVMEVIKLLTMSGPKPQRESSVDKDLFTYLSVFYVN